MMRDRINPEKHLFFTSINWWKNAFKQWSGDLFEVKKLLKIKYIKCHDLKLQYNKVIDFNTVYLTIKITFLILCFLLYVY